MVALEKKRYDDEVHGEIETAHLGYLESQDAFYVGYLKGVGRVYQQTFMDTYSKVACAKLYTSKLPILGILTDLGAEYCGKVESHDYQLYLVLNTI